jgi:membrane fusion protein (multidrug efflux system)
MPWRAGLAACLALVVWGCGGGGRGPAGGGTAAGTHEGGEHEAEADAIAVQVAPIRREPLSSLYSTSATLRAERSATIIARTRGVIRSLEVEEGQWVREGAPVAVLEDDEQKIAFERSRTTRDTKRREYERARQLHAQGLLSEEAYETVRRETEDAEHAASLAELALARTIVRAPFAGRIVRRHLDVGATVGDGTAVYDLADLDPLYADVNVPERHLARLAPGQEVRLTTDAGGAAVRARIERLAPAVDPATGTVKVTLAVTGARELRPGAFVRVDIVTDTHAEALVVPRSALVAEGPRWHLFRLAKGGDTVEQVEVTLGFEEGDRVEVVGAAGDGQAGRLEPGTPVVTTGASALSDGARIKVVEGESRPRDVPA